VCAIVHKEAGRDKGGGKFKVSIIFKVYDLPIANQCKEV